MVPITFPKFADRWVASAAAPLMTLTLLVPYLAGDRCAPAAAGLRSDRLGSLPPPLLVTSVPPSTLEERGESSPPGEPGALLST
jgi:hypothetical protein